MSEGPVAHPVNRWFSGTSPLWAGNPISMTSFGWPRMRSAALLLAGMLHLLSIPAEPVVHGWLHASPHLAGWSADPAGTDGGQFHQELVCVVCQGLNEHARPETASSPVAASAPLLTLRSIGVQRPNPVSRAQLQARAPPA
jgi:hypothetical protein